MAQISGGSNSKIQWKKGAQGSRLVHVLDPIGNAFFTKNIFRPPSLTMTLDLRQIGGGSLPSYVKTAPTSNSPGPNATLSTITMTVQMPSAALDMMTVTEYVITIFLTGQKTPSLESKTQLGQLPGPGQRRLS